MILSLKYLLVAGMAVLLIGLGATWGLEYVSVNQPSGPLKVETVSGPMKLEMNVDKVEYKIGETVNITLTLTNLGNETATLDFASPPEFNYIVYNESLDRIFQFDLSCPFLQYGFTVDLEPNEHRGFTFFWNQEDLWDPEGKMWIQGENWTVPHHVQPGTYFIAGETGHGHVDQPYYIDKIKTQLIQIEIMHY